MVQLCLWTNMRIKQWLVLDASAFQCMRAGFLCLKCDNFAPLHTLTYIIGHYNPLDGNPQIIVQRCQIAAPKWQNDISSAADNAIFKNKVQNIECSFGCVTRSTVLVKPNVVNILLLNFCEEKFVQLSLLTVTASPCSFLKKNGTIMPLE